MNEKNVEIVGKVLHEWAEAIRADWGNIDGRSCRQELFSLEDALFIEEPLVIEDVRYWAGICPEGKEHWSWFCRDKGCVDYITGIKPSKKES